MPTNDRAARLDEGEYSGALGAWRVAFGGREDSLGASWELAAIEERWGDSLFFCGESDSAAHYHAAQRALVPLGRVFSSKAESDRRMKAYARVTNKLYAIGPDGKPRPGNDGQPHPRFTPIVPRQETATPPPETSAEERRDAVLSVRETRTRQQTELGQLDDGGNHWRYGDLGALWLDAAKALALHHPADARRACQWSLHYFDLYHKAWSAHLPASRWDSDGSAEMIEVQDLENSLAAGTAESSPPDWVPLLLEGAWQHALAAFGDEEPASEFKPLAVLLAEACQTAGRQEVAQRLRAKLSE